MPTSTVHGELPDGVTVAPDGHVYGAMFTYEFRRYTSAASTEDRWATLEPKVRHTLSTSAGRFGVQKCVVRGCTKCRLHPEDLNDTSLSDAVEAAEAS